MAVTIIDHNISKYEMVVSADQSLVVPDGPKSIHLARGLTIDHSVSKYEKAVTNSLA